MTNKINSEYKKLKYCAARYVWPRRYKSPPRSPKINWVQWWEKKFNDNYSIYVGQLSERKRKKIRN